MRREGLVKKHRGRLLQQQGRLRRSAADTARRPTCHKLGGCSCGEDGDTYYEEERREPDNDFLGIGEWL